MTKGRLSSMVPAMIRESAIRVNGKNELCRMSIHCGNRESRRGREANVSRQHGDFVRREAGVSRQPEDLVCRETGPRDSGEEVEVKLAAIQRRARVAAGARQAGGDEGLASRSHCADHLVWRRVRRGDPPDYSLAIEHDSRGQSLHAQLSPAHPPTVGEEG